MDETYIGGVKRGVKRVRAFPLPRVTSENLAKALAANVNPKAKVMTDESVLYTFVNDEAGIHDRNSKNSGSWVCERTNYPDPTCLL